MYVHIHHGTKVSEIKKKLISKFAAFKQAKEHLHELVDKIGITDPGHKHEMLISEQDAAVHTLSCETKSRTKG